MRKILLSIAVLLILASSAGCLFDSLLFDINDWDLSACSGDLDVCAELFLDNKDKFVDMDDLYDCLPFP